MYFDSRIHVDDDGFRSARPAGSAPAGAIVAIGDSWTFGYAVDHEQTYPYLLSVRLGEPVVNAGVPAYGSAAVHLLFRRHVARLAPRTVVYLAGMHSRSRCAPEQAAATLIPCFFRDTTGRIVLATPAPGAVKRAVARGRPPRARCGARRRTTSDSSTTSSRTSSNDTLSCRASTGSGWCSSTTAATTATRWLVPATGGAPASSTSTARWWAEHVGAALAQLPHGAAHVRRAPLKARSA